MARRSFAPVPSESSGGIQANVAKVLGGARSNRRQNEPVPASGPGFFFEMAAPNMVFPGIAQPRQGFPLFGQGTWMTAVQGAHLPGNLLQAPGRCAEVGVWMPPRTASPCNFNC